LAVAGAIGAGAAGVFTTGLEGADVAADEVGAHAVTIKAALTRRSIAVQGERRVKRRCVKLFRSFMFVFPF
jgi:hypothetical protein